MAAVQITEDSSSVSIIYIYIYIFYSSCLLATLSPKNNSPQEGISHMGFLGRKHELFVCRIFVGWFFFLLGGDLILSPGCYGTCSSTPVSDSHVLRL